MNQNSIRFMNWSKVIGHVIGGNSLCTKSQQFSSGLICNFNNGKVICDNVFGIPTKATKSDNALSKQALIRARPNRMNRAYYLVTHHTGHWWSLPIQSSSGHHVGIIQTKCLYFNQNLLAFRILKLKGTQIKCLICISFVH